MYLYKITKKKISVFVKFTLFLCNISKSDFLTFLEFSLIYQVCNNDKMFTLITVRGNEMFNSIKTNFLEILVSILEGYKEFRVIVSLFSYFVSVTSLYSDISLLVWVHWNLIAY